MSKKNGTYEMYEKKQIRMKFAICTKKKYYVSYVLKKNTTYPYVLKKNTTYPYVLKKILRTKVPKHDEKLIRPKLPKSAEFASILFVNGLGLRKYFIPGCDWAGGQVGI